MSRIGLPSFSKVPWLASIFQRFASFLSSFLNYVAPSWAVAASKDPSRDYCDEGTDAPQCADGFPPTKEQVDDSINQFLNKVDRKAICNLVSMHTAGQPCSIIDDKTSYGSFNACFFVRLDNDRSERIVRIPIAPVTISAWAKLQGEVATMRYIEQRTTIPVPRVLAFGKDVSLVAAQETPFIIMTVIPGKQLHKKTFLEASTLQRKNLFTGLIDFMAQLRQLEFHAGGSLLLGDDSLGPIHSMAANEYQRNSQTVLAPKTAMNAGDYLEYFLGILAKTCELPSEGLDPSTAKLERLALHSASHEARVAIDVASTTFILTHTDLGPGNILINDDFDIVGLIDWEFSHTVPLALFTPPSWIVGHDPDMVYAVLSRVRYGLSRARILVEFRDVLAQGKDSGRSSWETLWHEWGFDVTPDGTLLHTLSPIAHITHKPSSLIDVYFFSIFPRLYRRKPQQEVVDEVLAQPENAHLNDQIAQILERSQRYTQYLQRMGLATEDSESAHIQEWLAEVEEVFKNR